MLDTLRVASLTFCSSAGIWDELHFGARIRMAEIGNHAKIVCAGAFKGEKVSSGGAKRNHADGTARVNVT